MLRDKKGLRGQSNQIGGRMVGYIMVMAGYWYWLHL